MGKLETKVDFDSINKHIKEEGLDINIIRIIYDGLTKNERKELEAKQGATILKEGEVLARFPSDFNPLYKDKAVGVLYLGA